MSNIIDLLNRPIEETGYAFAAVSHGKIISGRVSLRGISLCESYFEIKKIKIRWYFNREGRLNHLAIDDNTNRTSKEIFQILPKDNHPSWHVALLSENEVDPDLRENGYLDWNFSIGRYNAIPDDNALKFLDSQNSGFPMVHQHIINIGHKLAYTLKERLENNTLERVHTLYPNQKELTDFLPPERELLGKIGSLFGKVRHTARGITLQYEKRKHY